MTFAVRPIGLRVGAFVFTPTISADTSNYNLKAAAIAAGWDQVTPLRATVTVNAGIVLSATATSGYGFDTGATFPAGTVLTLICQGYICGMGGAGGGNLLPQPGGPALRAQYSIAIDAIGGVIAGGGGGGAYGVYQGDQIYSGGGGRSGRNSAAGGSSAYDTGKPGTFSSGGDAGYVSGSYGRGGTTGAGSPGYFGGGGGGGGWGAAGGVGSLGGAGDGASGAAGGAAVVGNSYITWINTGTRYGAIT